MPSLMRGNLVMVSPEICTGGAIKKNWVTASIHIANGSRLRFLTFSMPPYEEGSSATSEVDVPHGVDPMW